MQFSNMQHPSKQSGAMTSCDMTKAKVGIGNVTKLSQNVNKRFWHANGGRVQLYMADIGPPFQATASFAVRCMCNLSLKKVRLVFGCSF